MTERFAGRLARTLGGYDRTPADLPGWEDGATVEYQAAVQTEERWDAEPERFPVARHGYDRDAVDHHLEALERELAELRERGPSATEISAEITRIGEQTAKILQAAHQAAHETRHDAQAEADRCVADAAANALAITDEAQQRLRRLDTETDQVWRERARLIEDVRAVSAALSSLADDAAVRFPSEPEKAAGSVAAVPSPEPLPEPGPASSSENENGFAGLA